MIKKSYIHVDSSKRNKNPKNIYDTETLNLQPYPLYFTNNSNIVKVYFPKHKFKSGEKIVFSNVISKNSVLKNIISTKKNSKYLKINHKNHGLSMYSRYDPFDSSYFTKIDYVEDLPNRFNSLDTIPDVINVYYTLNINPILKIKLSNVSTIGNIPSNFLNKVHDVYLLFTLKNGIFIVDKDNYLIKTNFPSNINYCEKNNIIIDNENKIFNNVSYINFLNLYGIPLTHINNNDTISDLKYFIIGETTKDTFSIDIKYSAIVDPETNFYTLDDANNFDEINELSTHHINNRGGGSMIFVRKVLEITEFYPNPNSYRYELEKSYSNVISAKIISSTFPNSQKIINQTFNYSNNKFYWRNLNDGTYIYQIALNPGNYSPTQLKIELETKLNQTLKYPYSVDFITDPNPSIIKNSTPINNIKYDLNGIYKYHYFDVDISEVTDTFTISSYNLIQQTDSINKSIITPYNVNLEIEFNNNDNLDYYDYIYFTNSSLTQNLINKYTVNNLYKRIDKTKNMFELDLEKKILINFFDTDLSQTILLSINTDTSLTNFNFNQFNNQITLLNNKLALGDILITDQFENKINAYVVSEIINDNLFTIKNKNEFSMIFDNHLINNNLITDIIKYVNQAQNKINIIKIFHPNHNLSILDKIQILNSTSVNGVPSKAINSTHSIYRIIDKDNYEIYIDSINPNNIIIDGLNTVTIKYPSEFQLLFNFDDTIGDILGFNAVGNQYSITPYKSSINNYDKYENQIITHSPKKLSMTGYDYFYLCCDEFPTIDNTHPVENVFTIVRWTDSPGSVIYDSYVPTKKTFKYPIKNLNALNFSMYHPDGRLVDFNLLNHSFLIEIVQQM